MPYKISGLKTETLRVIVINESDWTVANNTVISGSGPYNVTTTSGLKTVVGLFDTGEVITYGNVMPAFY